MREEQISVYFPKKVLKNQEFEIPHGKFKKGAVYNKTGIRSRHVSGKEELVSDMAAASAFQLVKQYGRGIDFLILCTQTPDYQLPSTACIVQNKLGLPSSVGALDINLGCSGFIYSLAVAKGMLSTGISHGMLLIMAEAYSKHIHPEDYSTRTIFGDAACSIFLLGEDAEKIGEFSLGTDGTGYNNLIIPASGEAGKAISNRDKLLVDASGKRTKENLYMNGLEIFNFALDRIPPLVDDVLKKNRLQMEDIALIIPHQANQFMLNELREILGVTEDKFYINMESIGNTVSASIPIALKMALEDGKLEKGDKVMLLGFGVGYSWGGVVITI